MKKQSLTFAFFLALAGCSQQPAANNAAPNTGTTPSPSPTGAPVAAATPGSTPVPTPAPTPKPEPVILKEGTAIRIRTTATLSTKTHETGQKFDATLAEPLRLGERTLAPKGARVDGLIAESDDGGRVKGVASLAVRITAVEINGKMVPVSTGSQSVQAKATKRKDAMKVGIASGVGAAIGAIAGGGKGAAIGAGAGAGAGAGYVAATHGDPAVIAAESLLAFKLRQPVELK